MNMEMLWAVVGVSITVCLLARGVNKWFDRKYAGNPNGRASRCSSQSTQELMVQVLKSMNCEMHLDENNEDWYSVEYQGGNFSISIEGSWVRMIYPFWYIVELSDIDKLATARQLINEINQSTRGHWLIYVINEEQNKMYVHTTSHFMFTRELTDLVECLRYYFGNCFAIRQEFECRMAIEESKK